MTDFNVSGSNVNGMGSGEIDNWQDIDSNILCGMLGPDETPEEVHLSSAIDDRWQISAAVVITVIACIALMIALLRQWDNGWPKGNASHGNTAISRPRDTGPRNVEDF